MDKQRYDELFLTESREHVSAVNRRLLELEQGGGTDPIETVSAIFRAVHTIKGMSATMGYAAVAELSHELETVLDTLRVQDGSADPDLLELLFQSADLLESSIEAAVAGREEPAAMAGMTERLRSAVVARVHAFRVDAPDEPGVLVRVRLSPDTPLRGVRAYLAVNAARTLGDITAMVPAIADLQSDSFGSDFAMRLVTTVPARTIEGTILKVGDIASVTVGEDPESIKRSSGVGRLTPATGMHPVPGISRRTPSAGLPKVSAADTGASRRLIRIDLRHLDTLMNVVGELVITRGRLQQIAGERGDLALEDSVNEASRLISELRDEITASRLVPAGQVFDRFPRMVRDTARVLGKEVEFLIEGRDIELDRSMLDDVADSLVHLLRNALDHGLESRADRIAAGKPPVGRLVLSAARERSAAVIRVTDDGRGISRANVLARAKRDGLLDDSRTEITEEELLRLLTRPGFTTAASVTGVSGRGVGIDAVHTRVRALGGAIDVRSVEGEGTSVILRLPLTLAIVRAVLARAAGETYAIPGAHVSETIELTPDIVTTVQDREFLRLRDDIIPLCRMRRLFALPSIRDDDADVVQHALILDLGDRRAALIVDELIGQEEIVVKQFDAVREGLPYFGGATLLADGSPALIVDVSTLV